jgi:hypothetical protein
MAITGREIKVKILNKSIFLIMLAIVTLPGRATAQTAQDIANSDSGISTESGRDAKWYLAQHQKLSADFDTLKPQQPGIIDAYVLVAGLDGDPVFQKESAETAKVLSRRFNAEGRTILLASGKDSKLVQASPSNIAAALAAIAAKMDTAEDVLILYTTSHGNAKIGIVYKDDAGSFGMISPVRMAKLIEELGIKRKLVMISACYSGVFVPALANDDSIIITAASSSRSSFGCAPGNDWTFFGDALINNAFRSPLSVPKAAALAKEKIEEWEKKLDLKPSKPQTSFGTKSGLWLTPLEARMPTEPSTPTGRPATQTNEVAKAK